MKSNAEMTKTELMTALAKAERALDLANVKATGMVAGSPEMVAAIEAENVRDGIRRQLWNS
jgi:hypothetical protein